MRKKSYAGCLGLSLDISSQFTLKMCAATKNNEKLLKTPLLEGSRLFKVIDVNKSKKLVASACYYNSVYVPTCNRLHATRANSSKINHILGVPLFDACVCSPPYT